MTERSIDREPSISSSTTEAEAYDENEKITNSEGSYAMKNMDEQEVGDDVERAGLLPPADHEKPPPKEPDNSMRSAIIWMVVNTLATIGIVSLRNPPF